MQEMTGPMPDLFSGCISVKVSTFLNGLPRAPLRKCPMVPCGRRFLVSPLKY